MKICNARRPQTGGHFDIAANNQFNNFKTWQIAVANRRLENNALPTGFGGTSACNADPGKGWEYSTVTGLLKDLSFTAKFFNMTDDRHNGYRRQPLAVGQSVGQPV